MVARKKTPMVSIRQTYKTVCILLAVFVFQAARADVTSEMTLSNCKSNIVAYVSVSRSIDSAGAALYYPATTMQAYKGCQITSIKLGMVSSSSDDAIRLFITKDLEGTADYEQTCTASKSGWNTFELDSPYTITGDAIYIGYEISGVIYLCVCEQLVSGEEWVKKNSDGWAVYDGKYSFAIEATVTGDLPKYNVSFESLYLPSYTTTGTAIGCSGTFINLGVDTVENITLTYYEDSVATYSETVDVSATVNRATGSFAAGGYSMSKEGNPLMYLAITAVNGNDDLDPSDNTSRSKSVLCRESFTARNVLAEVFSTELCVNCAAAHQRIEATYGDIDNLIEVGHHAGYYTDPYTVAESSEYEWFYGTMVYAPAVMIDRTRFDNYEDGYIYDDTPITEPADDYLMALYEEAAAAPAFTTVGLTTDYDADTRLLTVNVEGEQLLTVDGMDSLRLNVFIIEDSIFTTTQKDTNGEFYHRWSVREVLTSTWGDEIDTENGYKATYDLTIADTIDISQAYVVAFVANYDSTAPLNCRVMNSAKAKVVSDSDITGIAEVKTGSQAAARINGSSIITAEGTKSVGIYDMQGRCLLSINLSDNGSRYIPINTMPQGTYILKAVGSEGNMTCKFTR